MLFDSELQHVDEHREQKQRQRARAVYGPRMEAAEVHVSYSCPRCGGRHVRADCVTREPGEKSG
jgi:hypothetical protein